MTTQDKLEYLYRYKALTDAISRKQDECDKLRTFCEKSTTALSDAPRGGASSREDMYIKLAEVEEVIKGMVQHEARIFKRIMDGFYALCDLMMCEVLTKKYILFMSEREIAQILHKSQSYVRQLHDKALEKLILDFDE